MSQRARPTPGTGKGRDGSTETRHRVIAALGCPKSLASACRRQRRSAMPMVPLSLAARCSRREAVIGRRAISATTAPRPPCRNPSSMQARTDLSSPASTWMTRSGDRPACSSPGANKSCCATHHRTLPGVRAAIPATKQAAAAPSTAPFPPPATSCRHPSASPPPGNLRSSVGTPKGSTSRVRAPSPSSCAIRSRSAKKAGLTGRVFMRGGCSEGCHSGFSLLCSLFVLIPAKSQCESDEM